MSFEIKSNYFMYNISHCTHTKHTILCTFFYQTMPTPTNDLHRKLEPILKEMLQEARGELKVESFKRKLI